MRPLRTNGIGIRVAMTTNVVELGGNVYDAFSASKKKLYDRRQTKIV